ncbi:MAG: CoA transferase, partial [Myxococcales bacterium]|nr:CoA transferase [Myxococcales bacterium]
MTAGHPWRPLSGVRVLDLSRLLPGPYATLVLQDLGATVDKLEDTAGGDYLRFLPPLAEGENPGFAALNRGKRSLSLDLKHPEGVRVFRRLVGAYDVLVEGFRPGVMERLGLSYETLSVDHPRLIYCAITGYGQDGPHRDRAGHDLSYLARAGIVAMAGPAGDIPALPGMQAADVAGGALPAAIGIVAALLDRARTGRGTYLDLSVAEGALALGMLGLMPALAGVSAARGEDLLTGGLAVYGTYLAKDGVPVTMATLEPKFWMTFCAQVGLSPDPEALVPGSHQRALRAR